MKKLTAVFTVVIIILTLADRSLAGDLVFPRTEAEIVKALKLQDGKTVFEGVEYVSQEGKVYKMIDGKRYQMRGLDSIVDSDITPKAGALIHFDYDSADIKPDSYALLDEYGKALRGELSSAILAVAGHTDSKGTDDYNKGLSEKRATAIKQYLVTKYSVPSNRLIVMACGKTKPIASNDTKDGQALNRRVEFIRLGGF